MGVFVTAYQKLTPFIGNLEMVNRPIRGRSPLLHD